MFGCLFVLFLVFFFPFVRFVIEIYLKWKLFHLESIYYDYSVQNL